MKVALISQNASPGLLIFRKDLIEQLVNNGHQVYALAADYDEAAKQQVAALGAIPVSYTLARAGTNPLADLRSIYQLFRRLRDIQPAVVISFFIKPSIYGTIAAKLAKNRVAVAMIEGLGYLYTDDGAQPSWRKRLLRAIHITLSNIAFGFADKVLVLNEDDHQELLSKLRIREDKLITFGPIGLNLADFDYHAPPSTDVIRFVFVGRILYDKGVEDFINAAKQVIQQTDKAEFLMLGGFDDNNPAGIPEADFKTLIEGSAISHYGHVDDIKQRLIESHVFVLPSYREGYPRSTQEAMAIGRPVITTNVNGCKDTVEQGKNGFIVEPRQPEALAEAMMHFVEQPQAVAEMGRHSRRFAEENYNAKTVNQRLMAICQIDS